uniref:Transmembrane protein 19 n=1 Tax=Phytophthora ramorum TaxID=164328 RepID=H3HDP5_PHYRM
MLVPLSRVLVAALLAGGLGRRGLKKQSLDVSGAAAACFVGFFTLAAGYRFGLLLLGFYFSGSKLTKVRASVKQQLDANYKPGGQRSAGQVLACSLLATLLAVYSVVQFGDADVALNFQDAPGQSYLVASYIGHYACCAADTWASELGVLSKSEPRLITTLRRVPPGTNGGVSVLGLAVSALGGAFIGALHYAASLASGTAQLQVITLGVVTGLFGSVLDSVLGATVQATYFDRSTRKICDESSTHADTWWSLSKWKPSSQVDSRKKKLLERNSRLAMARTSRTFNGSTVLPQVELTDDDALEYRGIADESFRETRALYENFLYERKQSLDSRRWKHVRTKGAMKVYRKRSAAIPGESASSTSSADPFEVEDDALLIGPASSLSVATKIPVVLCTGTVQGKLDDVMYGNFVQDTTSLRRRSIYAKDGMDDLVMLGTLEGPTETNPFDFLGVAWLLYSAPGLGAIVKQRDYVVLVNTGFATTSRGESLGYGIAQSVPHPGLPELKHLDIVRASMSFCVIYRQQSDQLVESFAHAVVDPRGTLMSFFALQEIANSIVGMGAPMECAEGKKLRWNLSTVDIQREEAVYKRLDGR